MGFCPIVRPAGMMCMAGWGDSISRAYHLQAERCLVSAPMSDGFLVQAHAKVSK